MKKLQSFFFWGFQAFNIIFLLGVLFSVWQAWPLTSYPPKTLIQQCVMYMVAADALFFLGYCVVSLIIRDRQARLKFKNPNAVPDLKLRLVFFKVMRWLSVSLTVFFVIGWLGIGLGWWSTVNHLDSGSIFLWFIITGLVAMVFFVAYVLIDLEVYKLQAKYQPPHEPPKPKLVGRDGKY